MKDSDLKPSCEQVINILPDPFVIIDQDYKIIAANSNYTGRYGISTEDIVGQLCHKVSHHSDEPCSQHGEHCPLEVVFKTGQPTQVMHIHYDHNGKEEYVQLQANPIFDEQGKVKYMGEYINPISQYYDSDALLVGRSGTMLRLVSMLQRVAPTQTTVLLQGESGVGKECVAQYLHQYSNRPDSPFVVVDCAGLAENLIESELFGYEKGAFTGATEQKKGLFEAANGGTLFIDEIGELPLLLQTKLLRALESGTVRRVGGTEYIKVDVRVVVATHRNIKKMIEKDAFREDLYYRLSAFPIEVPSLRDRKDDIPLLVEHFLRGIEGGDQYLPLPVNVIEKLLSYSYPGNIRELRNIVERAVILAADNVLLPEHILIEEKEPVDTTVEIKPVQDTTVVNHALLKRRDKLDTDSVMEVLQQTNGHRKQAAALLGVSERTLYRYMDKLKNLE